MLDKTVPEAGYPANIAKGQLSLRSHTYEAHSFSWCDPKNSRNIQRLVFNYPSGSASRFRPSALTPLIEDFGMISPEKRA